MGSFVFPTLQIDPISFWSSLHHLKLEQFKLEEGPFPLVGFSDIGKNQAFVKLNSDSFLCMEEAKHLGGKKTTSHAIPGYLLIGNTLSDYKSSAWKKSAFSSISKMVPNLSIH